MQNRSLSKAMAGAFHDPSGHPSARDLVAALGRAASLWQRLIHDVQAACGPLASEWSFSKALGWTLRLKQPARVLVYLTPGKSSFLASFALGEKACKAIDQAGVPADILAIIDAAPKYAEGRGVRIPVRTGTDVEAILRIAAIKVSTSK
jgi:hypothetical protein